MGPGVGMAPHGIVGGAGPTGMGDQSQLGAQSDPMNALQNLARQGGQPQPQPGKLSYLSD